MLTARDIKGAATLLPICAAALPNDLPGGPTNGKSPEAGEAGSFDEAMERVLTGQSSDPDADEPVSTEEPTSTSNQHATLDTDANQLAGLAACTVMQVEANLLTPSTSLHAPAEKDCTICGTESGFQTASSIAATTAVPIAGEPQQNLWTQQTQTEGVLSGRATPTGTPANPQTAVKEATASAPQVATGVPAGTAVIPERSQPKTDEPEAAKTSVVAPPAPNADLFPKASPNPQALTLEMVQLEPPTEDAKQKPPLPSKLGTTSAPEPPSSEACSSALVAEILMAPPEKVAAKTASLDPQRLVNLEPAPPFPTLHPAVRNTAPSSAAVSVPAAVAVLPVEHAGTSTAKSSSGLIKTNEMGSASPKPDRTLPGAATLSAASADSSRPQTVAEPSAGSPRDHLSPAFAGAPQPAAPPSHSVAPGASAREAAGASSSLSLEQLETRIVSVIAEVKRLKPDSMSVVLKPDSQTELHLHLQVQGGRVDVEARIQRGDMSELNGPWAQLQQNLAGQGIRLGDLQPTPTLRPSSSDSAGGFEQHHREQSAPRDFSETHQEAVPARPSAAANKHKPGLKLDRRSWESWA